MEQRREAREIVSQNTLRVEVLLNAA